MTRNKIQRNFDEIMKELVPTIAGYDFFTDFKKVYKNVLEIEIQLNILDTLIGKGDTFDDDFLHIIKKISRSCDCHTYYYCKKGMV